MKKFKKYDLLPIGILCATIIMGVYLNYRYSRIVIDSDMASELILANLLNKVGGFITDKWTYSTEIRVFHFQIINKLALKLFPNNWMNAKTFTQGVLFVLYALSTIFFSYCIGLKRKGIYIASILLLPLGFWYTFHNYFGGFYIVHTIYLLLLSGLTLRVLKNDYIDIKQIVIILIFSLICGMNGVKILLYFTIPSIFISVVFLLVKILKKDFDLKTTKNLREYKFFLAVFIATIGTLVGFVIYNLICKKIGFSASIHYTWGDFSIGSFLNTLSYYLKDFGYPSNEFFEMKVSINSLISFCGIGGIAIIIILLGSVIYLIKNINIIELFDRYLVIYIINAIVVMCLIMSFVTCETTGNNGTYTLPLVPFGFILIEIAIKNLDIKDVTKNLARLLIICIAALSSITNLSWYISYHPRRNSDLDYVIAYLEDNNIKNIYAEFWNSNVITALTNGDITTYTYNDIDPYTLSTYQDLRISDVYYPEDEPLYVLLNYDFNPGTNYEEDGIENIFSYNGYSIIKAKDLTTYTNHT